MNIRKIKCWFGFHAPDTIRIEKSLTDCEVLVQRCLYCDVVVHRFVNRDNRIRRIDCE